MLVIVAGLPGSGKSYFAEKLSARSGALYINSDQTRIALDALGRYSPSDKLQVYQQMVRQAASAIETKKDVVVDATFSHHTFRELFLTLAHGYNQPVRVIEVVADENLIRHRLSKPRKYSEADFSAYEVVRDEFEQIEIPHLVLESTDSNIEAMLSEAEKYLRSGTN